MAPRIRLQKQQSMELRQLASANLSELDSFFEAIQKLPQPVLTVKDVREIADTVFTSSPAIVETIVTQVLSLAGLRQRMSLKSRDVLLGLRYGIQAIEPRWPESDIAKWDEISDIVERILDSKSLSNVAKATELTYDYANILHATRVLTDVRPVFDDEADEIQGAVISLTLRLHYAASGEGRSISLAMDRDDVENLRKQCERALKKADLVKQQLGGFSNNWRAVIAGAAEE